MSEYERLLHEEVAQYYADPLGFVLAMYDWPINGEDGPDTWQADVLQELGKEVRARGYVGIGNVLPIRQAISSGHSIGKSADIAWIVDWLMSTRPRCRGTVSANTNYQLEFKTWAAVREWTARCRTGHWFEINAKIMFRKGLDPETGKPFRATWNCSPQSCAEENSESFAGQHAKGSTSWYVFDEASAIPDPIWEVAEGGLTDESFFVVVGNSTRNTGKFHEAVFGKQRDRWMSHVIDARKCKFANHRLIEEWAEDYGEDSDFFRVRVRGLAPLASEQQFIDAGRVWQAQKNRISRVNPREPLIAGVDVSGGGRAWTVCRFRRGVDARSVDPIRISGENTVKDDRQLVVSKLADALMRKGDQRVHAMFIDSAFGAPVVVELRNRGFKNVYEINFGAASPDDHQLNQRSYQWNLMKEWLPRGCLPDDMRLEADLTGPGFHLNKKNQLILESKESMQKRGLPSPDDGDALSLTFASPVAPVDDDVRTADDEIEVSTWG